MADDNDRKKKFSWAGLPGPQDPGMTPAPGGAQQGIQIIRNPSTGAAIGWFNPNTGERGSYPAEPTADEQWAMEGGSEATKHRAQTRAGLRPVIDARSRGGVNDPLAAAGRDAADIRANWMDRSSGGNWGTDPGFGNVGGSGSQLWADMTAHFNERNAQRASELSQARQRVIDRLNPDQSNATQTPSKTVSAVPTPALGSPSPGFSFGASALPAPIPAAAVSEVESNPD